MRCVKTWIVSTRVFKGTFYPLAAVARSRWSCRAISHWRFSGRALAAPVLLALVAFLGSPQRGCAQALTLTIELPIDDSLPYRPDDVLISSPGRLPVLRSELRSPPRTASPRAKAARQRTNGGRAAFGESPLVLGAFLRPAVPGDLDTR